MARPKKRYRDRDGLNYDEYSKWRATVLRRDNYVCQMCNNRKKRGSLQVHHIKRWANFPTIRYDPDNGITLCFLCHKSIHGKEDEMAPILLAKIKHCATDPARLAMLRAKYGIKEVDDGPKEKE